MYGNIRQKNLFNQQIVTGTLKNIKIVQWISLYHIEWIYENKLDLVLGNACNFLHDGYYQCHNLEFIRKQRNYTNL